MSPLKRNCSETAHKRTLPAPSAGAGSALLVLADYRLPVIGVSAGAGVGTALVVGEPMLPLPWP